MEWNKSNLMDEDETSKKLIGKDEASKNQVKNFAESKEGRPDPKKGPQ